MQSNQKKKQFSRIHELATLPSGVIEEKKKLNPNGLGKVLFIKAGNKLKY
jgi:hypothetical protein